MISKVVNITFSDRPSTYRLGIGHGDSGEALWSTRSCRLLPPEIAFIEKAERDYDEAQSILAKTYTEWEKNLSRS
jgi:hypothetical protein